MLFFLILNKVVFNWEARLQPAFNTRFYRSFILGDFPTCLTYSNNAQNNNTGTFYPKKGKSGLSIHFFDILSYNSISPLFSQSHFLSSNLLVVFVSLCLWDRHQIDAWLKDDDGSVCPIDTYGRIFKRYSPKCHRLRWPNEDAIFAPTSDLCSKAPKNCWKYDID